MNYWLFKTEPDVFSIDDLKSQGKTLWDGVRNYQARNFLRDLVKKGDQVLIYHSNWKPPGIAGLAEVSREAFEDGSATNPKSPYFDPSTLKRPNTWVAVELKFVKKWEKPLSLDSIRQHPQLQNMLVIRRGQRLSIQPVEKQDFDTILSLL